MRTVAFAADRPLDEPEHALLLLRRDDRAHPDLVVGAGVADGHALDRRDRGGHDVVPHPLRDEDPRRRGAVLTGVEVAPDLDRLGDRRRVGVVEHDHRRLAPQLEVHPLDGVGRVLRDQLAGRRIAGQRHEPDRGVPHEPVAGGHAFARDDLQDALREDLLRELDEPQDGQRRLLGGLDDLDVPCGERRPHLPDDHEQRVVPRGDARDDPERLAPDHRRVALDVLRCRLPLEVPRRAREEAEVVGHHARLVDGDPPRLADVERLEPRELLRVLVDHVRELQQQLHAVLRRLVAPRLPGLLGGLDGAVDVLLPGLRHLGDHLAGGRVEHLHRLARQRVHELAVDEHLLLAHRNAHRFLRGSKVESSLIDGRCADRRGSSRTHA